MIDEKKLEAVKTWYALFTTIIDADQSDVWKILKLKRLREEIKKAAPGLESN